MAVTAPPHNLSLPREHGAYLMLAGATVTAVALARAAVPAIGVELAMIAAFLARGPLDRLAIGLPLRRFDGAYLALLAAAAGAGTWLAADFAPVAGALAVALCVGSVLARRARAQRHRTIELVAMGGIGLSAGLGALAGGAAPAVAAAAALVLGIHGAVAVPLVHGQVRHRDTRRGLEMALAALAVVAGALVALGQPLAVLALIPRILRACAHRLRPPPRLAASAVGWRETFELAAAIALLLLVI